MGLTIAIAGATGAVGAEMIKTIEDRNIPVDKLVLLASARSVGKELVFKGEKIKVEELTENSFKGVDYALFSAGADRSKQFAPAAVNAGAVVIDNSSAFRMDEDIPLVVPEVNPEAAKTHKGIIANPNCSTIQLVVALEPIRKAVGIKRVVCATYQATSGAGAAAMEELVQQTKDVLDGKEVAIKNFQHQIAFNLIPHIDKFQENGYTKEELKMVYETRKIMSMPNLRVTATCVRVPVLRAHSESVNVETEKKLTAAEARDILSKGQGIQIVDDTANNVYPMPKDASGKYPVFIGRIREDISTENGIEMFVVADQLLKGAAYNAIQILELFL